MPTRNSERDPHDSTTSPPADASHPHPLHEHAAGISPTAGAAPAAGVAIRRARPADRDAIEPLMVAFNAVEQIAWDPAHARFALERLLASDDVGVILAAEHAGALVGYAVVTWGFDLEFAGRDAILTEIFVGAAYRRGRVGMTLMDAALETARDGGAAALHLSVDPANAPAMALYRRAAFHPSHRVLMTHVLRPQLSTPTRSA